MEDLYMIVMGIFGVILAVKPQKILKSEVLEDPSRVKLMRVFGGIIVICSVIVLILSYMINYYD